MNKPTHYLCRNSSLKGVPIGGAPSWDIAQKVCLVDVVTGKTPLHNTCFQIVRDDIQAKLFVRFERDTKQIYSNFRLHDEPLWKQDVFELFICDENSTDSYKELQSSPWDVRFDGIISYDKQGKRHLNVSWDALGWESLSNFDKVKKKLTSVWSIPYDVFSSRPKPGESWRLGVFAINQLENSQDLLSWQKVGIPNFHVPACFGYLDFE